MGLPASAGQDGLVGLRQAVRGDFRTAVDELSELVRIPAMAWDSFDPAQLDQAAQQVAALLREAGLADVGILQAPRPDGQPGA
ncbi:MAG TPA: dipeptidase, partial [Arthrobacter sp.]|nr:dipeptidase [Arthrobacter sp.]